MLAKTFNCPFFETSARLRVNIDESFHELVRQIKKHQQESGQGDKGDSKGGSGGCCVLL